MDAKEVFETKAKGIKECLEFITSEIQHKENYKKELEEDGCSTSIEIAKINFGKEIYQRLKNQYYTYERCIDILNKTNN